MHSRKTALILTGGGARAAYQVGVLAAIREILPDPQQNPFPILCGTSVGALNAAALASGAENFGVSVETLRELWSNLHAGDVYRADAWGMAATGASWLMAVAVGWLFKRSPRSLLDNAPLRRLLGERLDLDGIERAIAGRALHSVSITCSGYASGESVNFFQGRHDIEPWRRNQRIGAHVKLNIDHLMASSAMPFLFPAVRINREFFGDGSMRQMSPISSAIQLGAERVVVIGASRRPDENVRESSDQYPSLAQIAGHALSSIYLDSLAVDLDRMNRVNETLGLIPDTVRQAHHLKLRQIESLVITPSQRLDDLALRHAQSLPGPVRALLRGAGATNKYGSSLISYLLFEPPYTRALIDLGYGDTMARRDEVAAFLAGGLTQVKADSHEVSLSP